jgi:transposase
MLAALVAGERDSEVLAELARGRLRNKLPQLRQALRGRFGDHHALLVHLALGHLEHLKASIAELDAQVDRVLAPFAQARDRLDTITGVGSGQPSACSPRLGCTCRCSPPPATWPPGQAAARATTPTGGKRRSGRPTKGNR